MINLDLMKNLLDGVGVDIDRCAKILMPMVAEIEDEGHEA